MRFLLKLVLIALCFYPAYRLNAQSLKPNDNRYANFAIAPGFAVNGTGFHDGANTNSPIGFFLQGDIKTGNRFAVVPSIGIESGYDVYLGATVKYYLAPEFFVDGGAFFNSPVREIQIKLFHLGPL